MSAIDSVHSYDFVIGGTSYGGTWFLKDQTLRMSDSEGAATDTLSFTALDPDANRIFTRLQSFLMRIDGQDWFGGFLNGVKMVPTGNFQRREWQLTAVSHHEWLRQVESVALGYTHANIPTILTDVFMQNGLAWYDTSTHVNAGPTLESFTVAKNTKISDVIQMLAAAAAEGGTAWPWRVNPNASIWLNPENTESAPFAVALVKDADWYRGGNIYPVMKESFEIDWPEEQFFNQIDIDLGTRTLDAVTEHFSGDGSTCIFKLQEHNDIETVEHVKVNGTAYRFGNIGYDSFTTVNVLIDIVGGVLHFPELEPPATGTDNIEVRYRPNEDILVRKQSLAGYALAGDRWIPERVRNSSIATVEQAEIIAAALLAEFAEEFPVQVVVNVSRFGVRAGDMLTIHVPGVLQNVLESSLILPVRSVTVVPRRQDGRYNCKIVAGGRTRRFSEFFETGTAATYQNTKAPRTNKMIENVRVGHSLAVLVPGTYFELPDDFDPQEFA